MSNPDNYYDPPDDEEMEYCEFCGQEVEILDDFDGAEYTRCVNQFCPEKFEKYKGGNIAVVWDISNHLAEVEEALKDAQDTLKPVRRKLSWTQEKLAEREARLEEMSSNSDVVVRDTEYAIKMVENAVEYAYLDCNMSEEGRRVIWKNWAEVKKILENLG